jgi:hypothetical protein
MDVTCLIRTGPWVLTNTASENRCFLRPIWTFMSKSIKKKRNSTNSTNSRWNPWDFLLVLQPYMYMKKDKSSPCLRTMSWRLEGSVEVKVHTFSTSTLDGGEWSASLSGCCISGTNRIRGQMVSQIRSCCECGKRILSSCWKSNSGHPVRLGYPGMLINYTEQSPSGEPNNRLATQDISNLSTDSENSLRLLTRARSRSIPWARWIHFGIVWNTKFPSLNFSFSH